MTSTIKVVTLGTSSVTTSSDSVRSIGADKVIVTLDNEVVLTMAENIRKAAARGASK